MRFHNRHTASMRFVRLLGGNMTMHRMGRENDARRSEMPVSNC